MTGLGRERRYANGRNGWKADTAAAMTFCERYNIVTGTMPTRALPFLPLLLAIVGLPLAFGIVPPNGVYGVRTARTLGSESIWYSANASAGLTAVVLGVAGTIFIGFLAGRVSVSDRAKVVAAVGTTVFVATAMALAGLVGA
jgi:hypothetical protein